MTAPLTPAWPPAPLEAATAGVVPVEVTGPDPDLTETSGEQPTPQLATAGPVFFYDSADHDFPPGAEYVMLYMDGDFAYTGPINWPHYRWITVDGNRRAFAADYEPGNPVFEQPGELRRWAEARITARKRALIYSDRYELHAAHDELGPTLAASPGVIWWIPTLDGREWTPQQLTNDIASNWGVWIPPARIWANQFHDAGAWDISRLFGLWL